MRLADSLARASAGRSMLARIAIIAITTSSSIKVKAVADEAANSGLAVPSARFCFRDQGQHTFCFMIFSSFFLSQLEYFRPPRVMHLASDEESVDTRCDDRPA